MYQDPIIQILKSAGVKGVSGFGDVYRGVCPFHAGSSGKTFWLHLDAMAWGCWSTRCPQHSGGNLKQLLYAAGMSWSQANLRVQSLPERKPHSRTSPLDAVKSQADLDATGVLTRSHLSAWLVDWYLVDQIYSALSSSDMVPECLRTTDVYRNIKSLSYLLSRGIRPDALTKMAVGFDADSDSLVFPLFRISGDLVGLARRKPRPNESYYISGSPFPKGHERHEYVRVPRGDCLWGWNELQERISEGADVVVVEGYADQLTLLSYGYCAVAKLGSKLTAGQVQALAGLQNNVYIWPDKDRAGMRGAAEDVIRLLSSQNVRAVVPVCSDPAETPRLLAQRAISGAILPPDYLSMLPNLL